MEKVCDYKLCTGCGLCAVECPKNCIKMVEQRCFGHLYPIIDTEKCVDCKLCQKKCPTLHMQIKNKPRKAYAAWSKDKEDYKSSSSGGAASVFTNYVLSKGGVTYGCAMLPKIRVKHIRIDSIDNAKKLKGSKYVQSDIVDVLPQIKKDVEQGRLTLFIGTPCQVAAVKSLFKIQPQNLLLIDLICHGVPSQSTLQNHIKSIAPSSHYSNILFREGNDYVLVVLEEKAKEIYHQALFQPRYKEWYLNAFFDGYICRDSCYNCHYACPERVSDVTIGDFWGLGSQLPADEIPPHPNGCSVVMPVTQMGMDLVNKISSQMNLFERSVDEAIAGNDQLNTPTCWNRRKKMFKLLFPIVGKRAYYVAIMDKFLKYQMWQLKLKLKKI